MTNILAEAKPDSLAELFARDPLKLTREDRNAIVAELRRYREKFLADEAAGKKPVAPKKRPLEKAGPNITLDDLGIL